MESRAKFLGHPVHPMLVVLPLGLFIAAVGFWNIAGGVVGGLLAAVFGLVDWLAIPSGTRAKRIGLIHGASNVVVVLSFAGVWMARWNTADLAPTVATFIIEAGALALGAVAGWLGGELVDRLAVGIDDGANLDAPSSLSGQSARTR
jgi:uncharacterized membrane protein